MLGQALLSSDARNTAGILLLAIVAVEFGGTYMLRIVRGRETVTGFQHAFARAGHAHAGVLVTLSLVFLLPSGSVAVGCEGEGLQCQRWRAVRWNLAISARASSATSSACIEIRPRSCGGPSTGSPEGDGTWPRTPWPRRSPGRSNGRARSATR